MQLCQTDSLLKKIQVSKANAKKWLSMERSSVVNVSPTASHILMLRRVLDKVSVSANHPIKNKTCCRRYITNALGKDPLFHLSNSLCCLGLGLGPRMMEKLCGRYRKKLDWVASGRTNANFQNS